MISKPSIFSSLAAAPLSTLSRPRFVLGLVALSLCGLSAALALPWVVPRALSLLWGPLPRYELQLRGGDSCLRCAAKATEEESAAAAPDQGSPGAPHSGSADALPLGGARPVLAHTPSAAVRLDAPLTLALRPARPVAGPVFAHAFLGRAGAAATWPLILERTADGALQLRGLVRDVLDLGPHEHGRYELLFVVQRSPLPPTAAAARLLRSGDPAQLVRGELTVLPALDAERP